MKFFDKKLINSNFLNYKCQEKKKKKMSKKIVIIGAGLAGLGAAVKLQEFDHIDDVTIFEAQNYVGGRVKTIFLNEQDAETKEVAEKSQFALDLGAQWLHGTDNDLYRLAKAHQLLADEKSVEGLGIYIRSNGEVIEKKYVDKMAKAIGTFLNSIDVATVQNNNNNNNDITIQEYLDKMFDMTFLSTDQHLNAIYRDLYDWHQRFRIIDKSCQTLSDLSVMRWPDYQYINDLTLSNLKYGFQSIIDKILEKNPRILSRIELNTEVTAIGIDPKSKKVKLTLKRHLPSTTTNEEKTNSTHFYCDHLILTASLGVLQNSALLDGIKHDASVKNDTVCQTIRQMGFAGICKIFLIYSTKWWRNEQGFQLMWSAAERREMALQQNWLRHVTGFDPIFQNENVLMAWVGGEGVALVEAKSDAEILTDCTRVLRQFLCGKFDVATPTRVIRKKWLSNKFVQGSYSHIKPSCQNGIAPLKQPFLLDNVPKIVLAGEGINNVNYSTAHGAFESGIEQANLICQYLTKKTNNE